MLEKFDSSCIAPINSHEVFISWNGGNGAGLKKFDLNQNIWSTKNIHQGLGAYFIQSCTVYISKNYEMFLFSLALHHVQENANELWIYDLKREDLQKYSIFCENLDLNSIIKSFYGELYLVSLSGDNLVFSFHFFKLDLSKNPISCFKVHEKKVTFSKNPFLKGDYKKVEIIDFLVRTNQKVQ